MVCLTATSFGLAFLQTSLELLWPDRARVGLAMPLDLAMPSRSPIPHLGFWIYFFPLAALSLAAWSRLAESFPRAIDGLAVRSGSLTDWARSLLLLLLLYGGLGVVAAIVEHLFFHHFFTGPAHHVVVITAALGIVYAGRRPPFLHVSLAAPAHRARLRQRRRANLICIVLLVATYASWMAQRQLTMWLYQQSAAVSALLTLATLPMAALFAWALLHGSFASAARWSIRALEARQRRTTTQGGPDPRIRVAVEVASHAAAAALWLAAGRAIWSRAQRVPSTGTSTVRLGVDWYFLDLWNAITAAEAVILPAFAVLCGVGTYRALRPRPSHDREPANDRATSARVDR